METTFDPYARKTASVYANSDFFCIESCAGYRSVVDERIVAFLPREASDSDIGNAVLSALAAYRVVPVPDHAEFFSATRVEMRLTEWEQDLSARAGYKSTRNLYRGLKLVAVQLSDSEVTMSSTVRDRKRGFTGNGFSLTVASTLGAAVVGDSVKRALEECA